MGVLSCNPPHVPIRTSVNDLWSGFPVRVEKSIFANASSSFNTISILSQPIPVDTQEIRLPLYVPVIVRNSRLSTSYSFVSKCEATMLTRPGSPTNITLSANCSGFK